MTPAEAALIEVDDVIDCPRTSDERAFAWVTDRTQTEIWLKLESDGSASGFGLDELGSYQWAGFSRWWVPVERDATKKKAMAALKKPRRKKRHLEKEDSPMNDKTTLDRIAEMRCSLNSFAPGQWCASTQSAERPMIYEFADTPDGAVDLLYAKWIKRESAHCAALDYANGIVGGEK